MSNNIYQSDASQIEEPPTRFLEKLKYLGPGFILSASIVGSGELVMTTHLGAKAGFVTLWVILVSCLVKVTIQLEFGKHAIYSGETTFDAFNRLPGPRLGRANWSIWVWLLLMTLKFFQVSGIVGLVALISAMIFPAIHVWWWVFILATLVSLLVFRGYYAPIEKLSIVMIGLFTILTLTSVVMLQFTPYAFSWDNISNGLTFQLPAVAVAVAIGAFGITGIGGDEIMMYNYWLLEKGYGAKTGPYEKSEAWRKRAKGWIRIMYLDSLLAMVGYTIVTVAFYILGASVLHPQGIVPDKGDIIEVLSKMYTETLGMGAREVFLAGAFIVLFSTLLSALAGWTRLFGDAFTQISKANFRDNATRHKLVKILAWIIPLGWALLYIGFSHFFSGTPGIMVMLGGIATSIILLLVVFAAIHFRIKRLPEELKPSRYYDIALWLSILSIIAVGAYGIYKLFPNTNT